MIDIDKQHEYLSEYKLDPIEIGILCDQYPGLKKYWEQFITTVNLCRNEHADN
jgi:hypothetical protein